MMLAGALHRPRRSSQRLAKHYQTRQRQKYLRRRIFSLLLLLALITGGYYGANWVITKAFGERAADPSAEAPAGESPTTPIPVTTTALPFKAETFLSLGEGRPEQIAISETVSGLRQIALVTGTQKEPKMIGREERVAAFPLKMMNLARESNILVLSGMLPVQGSPSPITVGGEPALEAAGGEPDLFAWRPDPALGLVRVDYYALIAPLDPPEPTAIVIDKRLNVLWFYENGELVQTSRVATGRHLEGPAPSGANQATNYITPVGRFTIANRQVDPHYYPTDTQGGHPDNPLGTRWLGFSVYPGDNSVIWGIHGTNEPDRIGEWSSTGCIRLLNSEVEALFERAPLGTVVEIR
jgi:lipoprotein-anchoring transpeptidase ErfK/SrfK